MPATLVVIETRMIDTGVKKLAALQPLIGKRIRAFHNIRLFLCFNG